MSDAPGLINTHTDRQGQKSSSGYA